MMHHPEPDIPVLTAEEAYVGALLWTDTAAAVEAVAWLRSEDFRSPAAELVHRLVGELASHGVQPEPTAVLSLAISSDVTPGPQSIHELTRTLCKLFDHRATVPTSARFYACAALDQTIRRRIWEMTTRMRQFAEDADLDDLERINAREQEAIQDLRARLRDLAGRETPVGVAA